MAKVVSVSGRSSLPIRQCMQRLFRETNLRESDIDRGIQELLSVMIESLSEGKRIELRGFGIFDLSYRPARPARNPKTGAVSMVADRYIPRFRAGKRLKQLVDSGGGYHHDGDE